MEFGVQDLNGSAKKKGQSEPNLAAPVTLAILFQDEKLGLGIGDEPLQKKRCLMELGRLIFMKSILMFRGVPRICFHWELGAVSWILFHGF